MRTALEDALQVESRFGVARWRSFGSGCGAVLTVWLAAATSLGALQVEIDPTLLSTRTSTLVSATSTSGRFYPGSTPPPFRVLLTLLGGPIRTLEPASVTPTRITFLIAPLPEGFYGFVVQYQPVSGGPWVDGYRSRDRFFRAVLETNTALAYHVFEEALPLSQRNVSTFLTTSPTRVNGLITGTVDVPQHVNDGQEVCYLEWTRDFRLDGEGPAGVVFALDFLLDGTATFRFSIPFEITFDFPTVVYLGQTIRFRATSIEFPGGDSLAVDHNLSFSTLHSLWLNVPYDTLPPFDMSFNQLPDKLRVWGSVPLLSGVSFDIDPLDIGGPFDDGHAELQGVINHLGGHTSHGSSGGRIEPSVDGTRTVWAEPTRASDFWYSAGDQLVFLAAAGIPYVSAATAILVAAQVELNQVFDLDVESSDYMHLKPLYTYGFEALIDPSLPTGPYRLEHTFTVPFDLYLVAQYLYKLRASIVFDMPFVDPQVLAAWDLADIYWDDIGQLTSGVVEIPFVADLTVLTREDWVHEYDEYNVTLQDVTLRNYHPQEAEDEWQRIVSLTLPPPTPPSVLPTNRKETFPTKGELFVRGEANGDGKMDLSDAIYILGFLFLGTPTSLGCREAADVDDNGAIDLSDPVRLLGYIFLGGAAPSFPLPGCGEDPGAYDLGCEVYTACP